MASHFILFATNLWSQILMSKAIAQRCSLLSLPNIRRCLANKFRCLLCYSSLKAGFRAELLFANPIRSMFI
jgi:hypothetical protein